MQKQYNHFNLELFFKEYLLAENLSKVTIKNYLSDLRYFMMWLPHYSSEFSSERKEYILSLFFESPIKVQEVSLKSFKDFLVSHTESLKTINRRLSTLRSFFQFSLLTDIIDESSVGGLLNIIRPVKNIDDYHKQKLFESFTSEIKTNVSKSDFDHYVHEAKACLFS